MDLLKGRILPHDIPDPINDIIDFVQPELQAAINRGAIIYLFGEPYSDKQGIHDVHMNQGSQAGFARFNGVWNYKYKKPASNYLERWIFWAKESILEPFVKYANGLDRDRAEILSFIKHRITSGKIEAFNATIGRIIRRACGYQDLEYLYFLIRQEALKSSQT